MCINNIPHIPGNCPGSNAEHIFKIIHERMREFKKYRRIEKMSFIKKTK